MKIKKKIQTHILDLKKLPICLCVLFTDLFGKETFHSLLLRKSNATLLLQDCCQLRV